MRVQPQPAAAWREPTPDPDSGDELDLIGDGHESDSSANSAMEAGLLDFAFTAGLGDHYISLDDALDMTYPGKRLVLTLLTNVS